MSKTFEEMKKSELQKATELYGLEDQVEELSKELSIKADKPVPNVPNNDVYVTVLNAYKDSKAEASVGEVKTEKVGEPVKKPIADVIRRYARSKVMVIVTDHDNTKATEEELEGMVVPIRWGNRMGKVTQYVAMHGRPQYLMQGTIDNMSTILIPTNNPESSTRTRKRFSIVEVAGWTQDQLDAKKAEQRTKIAV